MSVPIYAPVPTRSFHVRVELPAEGAGLKSPELAEELENILNFQAQMIPSNYPDRRTWNPMFKKRSSV